MITTRKSRPAAAAALLVTFATVLATAAIDPPQDPTQKPDPTSPSTEKIEAVPGKEGVLLNDPRACPGYNLINPGRKETYLFDNDGRVVHTWTSEHPSGAAVYMLDNGNLFRPAEATKRSREFQGPAAAGRLQEFDWDGNLVWDFEYHSGKRLPHHDAIKLPNGNALLICWEMIDDDEAIAAGRRPETVKDSHLQPDCLVEIKPTGKTTGEVVWEWRSWDHLIQDHDSSKPNYGNVSEHPELFDLNYERAEEKPAPKQAITDDASKSKPADADKKSQPAPRKNPDWMHVNAVAYNADLDQIAMSSPNFDEIWIIDHSTTTEEAKGHTGGRRGKGGDILYRWGNPITYKRGTANDQRLFAQHNIHWIPKGLNGAGHLLVFNNGGRRKPVEHSSVDEFVPSTDSAGNYILLENGLFGPDQPLWSYTAPNKQNFYSWFISGAQRLPNGNTLINAGAVGVVFEVTPQGETVWKFSNPLKPTRNDTPKAGEPKKRFVAFASDRRKSLEITEEQGKKLDELDVALNTKLDEILDAEQLKGLADPNSNDPVEFSKRSPGDYLVQLERASLNATDAQKEQLRALKQEFDPQIAGLLTDAQKALVANFKKEQIAAAATRATRPRQGNTLFRATRYAVDHPAFAGKSLAPGKTLVELQAEDDANAKLKADAPASSK